MEIGSIKSDQIWRPRNPSRSNIVVQRVNVYSKIIYWYNEGNEKHIFEMPYVTFVDSFTLSE